MIDEEKLKKEQESRNYDDGRIVDITEQENNDGTDFCRTTTNSRRRGGPDAFVVFSGASDSQPSPSAL